MNRRSFFQTGLAAAMPLIGTSQTTVPAKVLPRTSKSIAASPLSIGFETLDRKMFDPDRTYSHLAELGVKWARCQTGWARTEQKRGEYDFAWLDSVVDNLRKIGIQPWFNLGYGNRLYTPGAPHESAVGWAPLNSPEAQQAWLKYVAKLGQRFAGRVSHWEIWNEPNGTGFWQPDKPDPARYVELVRMTAPIIRKHVAKCTLIGGAFAGFPVLDYAEGCFAAGLGKLVDIVSYHPYRPLPEASYEDELRAFRGMVNRYKPGMPVWQGENGAPSLPGSTGAMSELEWDETRQAKWLLRRILTDLNLGVELTSYFHTVDMVNYVWNSGQSGKTNSKGVLRGTDYSPKPAYYAYRNVCSLFDSETKHADFLLRVNATAPTSAATFIRKGFPIYAWWQPANLQEPFTPSKTRITAWHGAGASLENPVLVDLMSGTITSQLKTSRGGGSWSLNDAPLQDYPILLTDKSLFV